MNTLNKLFVLAALLFAIAAPSYATVNPSGTGPFLYYANDAYVLTGDVTCSSVTYGCLDFSGITSTSGGIDIDLNGHYIQNTGGRFGIKISSSVANIYIHDSAGGNWISGAFAIDIEDSATASGAWIYITGISAFGGIHVQSSNKSLYPVANGGSWYYYNTVYNGSFQMFSVDYPYFYGDTVDNRYDSTLDVSGGFVFSDSNYSDVEYSVVVGGTGSHSGLNMDDGVVYSCSSGTCSGGTFNYNSVYDVYDAGWEITGHWTGMTVTNNNFYRPIAAVFGMYSSYGPSLSYSTIQNNTATRDTVYAITQLFEFGSNGSGTSFFNNNTLDGNSIDTGWGSLVGYCCITGHNFANYSGNTVQNNHFNSAVQFQSAGGITDGGSNYCSSSNPSAAITCH